MSARSDTAITPSLRALIRTRLVARTLPSQTSSSKLFGGYGEGQTCECCGHTIARTEVLFEVELQPTAPSRQIMAMHRECFDAWAAECRAIMTGNGVPPCDRKGSVARGSPAASAAGANTTTGAGYVLSPF